MRTAILAAGLVATAWPVAAREDQWVFRPGEPPTAVFLSWSYDAVIFRATCDPVRHELILNYYGDGEVGLSAMRPMALAGRFTIKLRTRLVDGRLEGRAIATPQLLALLREPQDLDIEAPNAMDEAWHVGRADALAKVALTCAALPHRKGTTRHASPPPKRSMAGKHLTMPIKDEDERGRRPLDEAEAIQAARTAFRAAGRAEAEMPLVADGQSLPHFWLVLPAAPERGRTYKSASVDPDDGAVKIGDYEVIEAPITRRER